MDETGLSDVQRFIEQLNSDQNPSIPEFQGNDASLLLKTPRIAKPLKKNGRAPL